MFTYFEFHDSQLTVLEEEADRCIVELHPAYVHQSDGRPGIDPGEGFWQNIRIVITGARLRKPDLRLPCPIADGYLTVGDIRVSTIVPTVLRKGGCVSLKIQPMDAAGEVEIEGIGIEVQPISEPQGFETFPGVE